MITMVVFPGRGETMMMVLAHMVLLHLVGEIPFFLGLKDLV